MSTEIELEKLNLLIENGLSIKEIANEFEVNISTIKRRMKKNGLRSKFSSSKREEVRCLNCETVFTSLKGENRKFCSKSCSAIVSNSKRCKIVKEKIIKKRIRKEKKIGVCLNCNTDIIKSDGRSRAKYCSSMCQSIFRINDRVANDKAMRTLKGYLIREHGNTCMKCGWCEVNPISKKVPIELEHIDGNSENNKLDNLLLLCPNCHSLTPTYKALNKGNGRHKRMKRYEEGKSF